MPNTNYMSRYKAKQARKESMISFLLFIALLAVYAFIGTLELASLSY